MKLKFFLINYNLVANNFLDSKYMRTTVRTFISIIYEFMYAEGVVLQIYT